MSDKNMKNEKMEAIVSLTKRRGFIYQGSDIYGGLSGTWDFGPLGVALKRNIMQLWWKMFVEDREDMYGIDAAILMNQKVWKASGHVDTFSDPLVEDLVTKMRYRADHLIKDAGYSVDGLNLEALTNLIREKGIKSPAGNDLSDVRTFNMMFTTNVGPVDTVNSVPRITYSEDETCNINLGKYDITLSSGKKCEIENKCHVACKFRKPHNISSCHMLIVEFIVDAPMTKV